MENSEDEIDRVKFYSVADLSSGFYLGRIEDILGVYKEETPYKNINEIIEFYNIQQFFNHQMYSVTWDKKMIVKYIQIMKKFNRDIGIYFSGIDDINIRMNLESVIIEYLDDFWILIEKYKVYNNISENCFSMIMNNPKTRITDILHCKDIVKRYGNIVKDYLIDNVNCAEIIIKEYLVVKDKGDKRCYFPCELTMQDKSCILLNYIDSNIANENYLKLVYESLGNSELILTDKVRLKAKKKYEEQIGEFFLNNSGVTYGMEVFFSDNQIIDKEVKPTNNVLYISYSTKWISSNLDYATILNNFIYIFEFTDWQFRFQHVHKKSDMGVLERILGIKGNHEYAEGVAFTQKQALALMQMNGYYDLLERNSIRLENVVKWFFEEYLKEEFGVKGFYINLPSKDTTYVEKCRSIASEIDSILKQFKLWVEEGEIDKDLIQISSEHMFIKNIPSMIPKKYIYSVGDAYITISNLLFSDQSILHYISKISISYKNFYDLAIAQKLRYDDFEEYQKVGLDVLISYKLISLDSKGIVMISKEKLWLLKELFENEVLCNNYIQAFSASITELMDQGIITYGSALMSIPEQDYFNYILNKSEFSNGLDLRNKYIHGTQVLDNNQNKQDYYTFLRILILIVIKINEEFCIHD